MKYCIVQHYILVLSVYQSNHLRVSGLQRANKIPFDHMVPYQTTMEIKTNAMRLHCFKVNSNPLGTMCSLGMFFLKRGKHPFGRKTSNYQNGPTLTLNVILALYLIRQTIL